MRAVAAAAAALALSACFIKPEPPSGGSGDGGTGDGVVADARSACTMFGPWDAPQALDTVNSASDDYDPSLSGDHSMLVLRSERDGGPALFMALWNEDLGRFNSPFKLQLATYGQAARLSPDGLALWYTSYTGTQDILEITRATTSAQFLDANRRPFTPFASSGYDEDSITIAGDLLSAVVMMRPAGAAASDVFIAHREAPGEAFSQPIAALTLDDDDGQGCCASLGPDGLTVIWHGSPGPLPFGIHQAMRGGRSEQFGTPMPFTPFDEPSFQYQDASLSYDGTRLAFARRLDGGNWDLYMMKRDCVQ